MKKINKILGGILVASLAVVSVAACTKKNDAVDNTPTYDISLGVVTSSADSVEAKKYVYTTELVEYTNVNNNAIICNNAYGVVNDTFYIVSTVNDASDSNKSKLAVSKINTNAVVTDSYYLNIVSEEENVPDEIVQLVDKTNAAMPAGSSEETYQCSLGYSNVDILDDGSVMGIVEYYYSYYSYLDYSSIYTTEKYLCKWDRNGQLLWSAEVWADKAIDDTLIVKNTIAASNYYIVVAALNNADYKMMIYDANGIVKSSQAVLENSEIVNIDDTVMLATGSLLAFYEEDGTCKAKYLDITTGTLSGSIVLPDYMALNGYMSVTKGVNHDLVFADSIGIYGFNANSSSFDVLMDYTNSNFVGNYVGELGFVSSGSFFGLYSDMQNYGDRIAFFKAVESTAVSEVDDKAIVVLGSYRLPVSVREQLLAFNKENAIYRVIVKEYSYYDTLAEPNKGAKQLEEEIMAGTGPDLVIMDPGLLNTYFLVNNGKLLPWSYLVNADDNFSSADYITSVMDVYAINGLDYIMVYDFMYRAFLGNTDIVGKGPAWSVKDFKKALNKATADDAVLYAYNSQEDYLEKLISFSALEYIDYENKKSSFNSSDFIDMLNYGAGLSVTANEELSVYSSLGGSYRNGNILLKEANMVRVDSFWNDAYRYFDGKASVVGFPSSNGTSAVIEYVDYPIMIMSEENIGGAWTFAKTFYSFDYQCRIVNAIPMSYTAFETWGNRALANQNYTGVNELGESYSYLATYYYDGAEHEIPDITADNIDSIKGMILVTDKAACYDKTIRAIIEEEAYKCFAGSQTAKQAATNIDSRVTAYLFN